LSKVENPWFWQVLDVLHQSVPELSVDQICFDVLWEVARVEAAIVDLLKLQSITTPNGSNNSTMMCALALKDSIAKDFDAVQSHVWCLPHNLHLTAKAGLAELEILLVNDEEMADPLYQLIFKIHKSSQLCKNYTAQLTNAKKPTRELVAPVRTRWSLQDRMELEKLLAMERSLWAWKLTDAEWGNLETMRKLLHPLAYALTQVMDLLEDAVLCSGDHILEAMWMAIMVKLWEYYTKMEDLKLYMLALGLHPSFKLHWIQEQGWEVHFVVWVHEVLQQELDAALEGLDLEPATNKENERDNNFDKDFYGERTQDGELERYLMEPKRVKGQDVLEYWRLQKDLPGLQCIASGIMAIPGSTCK
ncbi:hypothetical protein M427DRAFT_59284, partial [Gonapodya prolifera JEL478]